MVSVAVALLLSVPVPRTVVPLRKVTVPVGLVVAMPVTARPISSFGLPCKDAQLSGLRNSESQSVTRAIVRAGERKPLAHCQARRAGQGRHHRKRHSFTAACGGDRHRPADPVQVPHPLIMAAICAIGAFIGWFFPKK